MSLLAWFDNRTLFDCQCLLAVMFAFVFFWLSRVYPTIRGIRSVAFSFLLGIPCTFLLLAHGHISDLLSVVVANVLGAACFILLYDGVALFVEGARKTLWLVAAGIAANAVIYYATEIHPANLPRVVAIGLFCSLLRAFTAWELLSHSLGATHGNVTVANNRTAMRFLGGALALSSGVGLLGVAYSLVTGASPDPLQRGASQSADMLMNVGYIGLYGLSFLLMAGHEMIARSQEESEKDLLSGAFNRRGIESRLATELKRYTRSHQALSIALVDIDHFKALNDCFGHACGDAAIRHVSQAIARSLRDSDYFGRYGGDEFLVVLPVTPARHAVVALERLARAVAAIPLPGDARPLTLSIGLTEACLDDDPLSVIARADEALYRAKTDGRDRHHTVLPLNPSVNIEIPRSPRPRTSSETITR